MTMWKDELNVGDKVFHIITGRVGTILDSDSSDGSFYLVEFSNEAKPSRCYAAYLSPEEDLAKDGLEYVRIRTRRMCS